MIRLSTLLPAALAASFLLFSCAKQEVGPDTGCSEQLAVPVSAHGLSSAEVATINGLFVGNRLDSRNLRYVRYVREAVQTYFPPYASFDSQVVTVEEYTNGLRIFTGQLSFAFKNGSFSFQNGQLSSGTSLDTSPTLSPGQVRDLFQATITQVDANRLNEVQRQCVSVEFGYFNLNAGTSNAPEKLVKAWRVSPKNQAYPYAYYQDEAGQLIYYDNGIRTFR
jgi:hypothetical protein